VTTATAIASLRERLGLSQHDLATKLGITITSVSRYENGRKPSRSALQQFADLAQDHGLEEFHQFFRAKWTAGVARRLQKLRSHGSERPVPVEDLRRWLGMAALITETLAELHKTYATVRCVPEDTGKLANSNYALFAIHGNVASKLAKSIEFYINPKKEDDPKA
jgi:transcriptional regulator with XRE-family HTH domain